MLSITTDLKIVFGGWWCSFCRHNGLERELTVAETDSLQILTLVSLNSVKKYINGRWGQDLPRYFLGLQNLGLLYLCVFTTLAW